MAAPGQLYQLAGPEGFDLDPDLDDVVVDDDERKRLHRVELLALSLCLVAYASENAAASPFDAVDIRADPRRVLFRALEHLANPATPPLRPADRAMPDAQPSATSATVAS